MVLTCRIILVKTVGNLYEMNPGEILLLQVEWINHPKYGDKFKVSQYQTKVSASVHGIKKYLGSRLTKGIGPVYAKRIVKVFGDKTLDVIEEDVNQLLEVILNWWMKTKLYMISQ
jgi:exodeoxyribonuclease V alpha subunit